MSRVSHDLAAVFRVPTCPVCGAPFDRIDPESAGDSRIPVLLVPCGHTCCRPCIRDRAAKLLQQQQQQPQPVVPACPQCDASIEVTVPNAGVSDCVRLLAAFEASSRATTADSTEDESGPLDPALREHLHRTCGGADLQTAERVARRHFAVQRRLQLQQQHLADANAEWTTARRAHETRGQISAALGSELHSIDERIRALQLERRVVREQLQTAYLAEGEDSRYIVECAIRLAQADRAVNQGADSLRRTSTLLSHLAPGIL